MTSILVLGFLAGMHHALEADHLAAVAALASQSHSARRTFGLGAAWGIGHALPLLLLGGTMLVAGWALPPTLGRWLDGAVGLMLIFLGGAVLTRFVRRRVHFHVHRHQGGPTHLHAHAHDGISGHDPLRHEHWHARALTLRAAATGVVHGLAGSGALIVLTLQSMHSIALGIFYIALFALGSLAGMALLTATISLPLQFSARRLTRVHAAIQGAAGLGTLVFGGYIVYSAL